jgi:predicted acetyltransferase
MALHIRAARSDELDDYVRTYRSVFGLGRPSAAELELTRLTIDPKRTLVAFDESQMVAIADSIAFDITVPGASLRMAGVTRVAVVTTHRRQGLLRSLMRTQLDQIHEHGEPIAGLYASEAPIYGRFGYGLATHHEAIEVTGHPSFRVEPNTQGTIAFVDVTQALQRFPAIWEVARQNQPGMPNVHPDRWRSLLAELPMIPHGLTEQYRVLYAENGVGLGYARYRLQRSPGGPYDTNLMLLDLIATTPAAYGALWRFVLHVDLVHRVTAQRRPVDEPLPFLLVDTRAVESRMPDGFNEGLWVRLVDVATALAGRRYGVEGTIVFEVRDEFCPWNVGRYRLEGSPTGATCSKTHISADLALDVSDLAAAYLGGTRFQQLLWSGRVAELSVGAVRQADGLFGGWPTPWCPLFF